MFTFNDDDQIITIILAHVTRVVQENDGAAGVYMMDGEVVTLPNNLIPEFMELLSNYYDRG